MLEPASARLRRSLVEAHEPVLEQLCVESAPGLVAALTLRQSRDTALRMLRQGELEGAAELIAQIESACEAQGLDPVFLKTVHLSAIDLLEAGKELAEAARLLDGLCGRFPADPDYASRLAAIALRAGNRAAARATYARLLARASGSPDAHRGLAVMDEEDGDAAAALGHWRAMQEARPRDPTAALAVVRLLARIGRPAEARQALQIAIAADPGLEPMLGTDLGLAVR